MTVLCQADARVVPMPVAVASALRIVNEPAIGEVDLPYLSQLAAFGAGRPSASRGRCPAVSMPSPTGEISGTPTSEGTFHPLVTLSDSNTPVTKRVEPVTLRIVPKLRVTTEDVADGQVGKEYSATVMSEGGLAEYSWQLAEGALPAALGLPPARPRRRSASPARRRRPAPRRSRSLSTTRSARSPSAASRSRSTRGRRRGAAARAGAFASHGRQLGRSPFLHHRRRLLRLPGRRRLRVRAQHRRQPDHPRALRPSPSAQRRLLESRARDPRRRERPDVLDAAGLEFAHDPPIRVNGASVTAEQLPVALPGGGQLDATGQLYRLTTRHARASRRAASAWRLSGDAGPVARPAHGRPARRLRRGLLERRRRRSLR